MSEIVWRDRAKIELLRTVKGYSEHQLDDKQRQMQTDVLVALVALFEIKHRVTVQVRLHNESLFFRSEIMDDGTLVTHYLGEEFGATYYYQQTAFPYQAYCINFNQIWESSHKYHITFDNKLSEEKFVEFLNSLGGPHNLDELRKLKEQRFERYRAMFAA